MGILSACTTLPTATPITTALTMISEDAEPSFVEIQEDTGLELGVWGISTERGDGVATLPAGHYRVVVRTVSAARSKNSTLVLGSGCCGFETVFRR